MLRFQKASASLAKQKGSKNPPPRDDSEDAHEEEEEDADAEGEPDSEFLQDTQDATTEVSPVSLQRPSCCRELIASTGNDRGRIRGRRESDGRRRRPDGSPDGSDTL